LFRDRLLWLTKKAYPSGRAFKMPKDGDFEKLHIALAKSESRAHEDTLAVLNSLIPDNADFSEDDATDWERRLGLITSTGATLAERKAAILRKMAHPGELLPRQNYRYLQLQLQNAGFDVYVHENRFESGGSWITQNPGSTYGGFGLGQAQMGMFQLGDFQIGLYSNNIIANSIDEDVDALFQVGTNFKSTFFIGGETLGDTADVPEVRKEEFRQLILRIKPVQTVGYLFINYT
jgi:hypothetical protein